MTMQSYPVTSSAISVIWYDEETGECAVVFRKNKTAYLGQPLPPIEFHRWINSSSIGGYWNNFLKGNYR
jgi:hypothetical protein